MAELDFRRCYDPTTAKMRSMRFCVRLERQSDSTSKSSRPMTAQARPRQRSSERWKAAIGHRLEHVWHSDEGLPRGGNSQPRRFWSHVERTAFFSGRRFASCVPTLSQSIAVWLSAVGSLLAIVFCFHET